MTHEHLVNGATYYIMTLVRGADHRVLNVHGAGEVGETDIWTNTHSTTQQWTAHRMADGSWAFAYKRNPSAYLAADGQFKPLRVKNLDPNHHASARWKAEDLGDGYLFCNVHEGNMALDLHASGTCDGSGVHLSTRHGHQNQRWRLARVQGCEC
ncbi:ricin B lectin domain-containing protein [Aspergillus multicolor]|uniref:ricin B lectin domain-containing protein n=1 Tax=Aspergillus multicolor TaxID=41759 RepID=UPI003CCCEEBC